MTITLRQEQVIFKEIYHFLAHLTISTTVVNGFASVFLLNPCRQLPTDNPGRCLCGPLRPLSSHPSLSSSVVPLSPEHLCRASCHFLKLFVTHLSVLLDCGFSEDGGLTYLYILTQYQIICDFMLTQTELIQKQPRRQERDSWRRKLSRAFSLLLLCWRLSPVYSSIGPGEPTFVEIALVSSFSFVSIPPFNKYLFKVSRHIQGEKKLWSKGQKDDCLT